MMMFDSAILHYILYTPSRGLHIINDGDAHFYNRTKAERLQTPFPEGGSLSRETGLRKATLKRSIGLHF